MAVHPEQVETFKKGSTTYFNSSLFFPPHVRDDVVRLYAFVRVADNFVDAQPQDSQGFLQFRKSWELSNRGQRSGNLIIDDFVGLSKEYAFEEAWTIAFLDSMQADLSIGRYETIEQLLAYIYGSAEVIGLYMARILGLSEKAASAACMQGRAMQMINFIRDVYEDHQLGRYYLPMSETTLEELSPTVVFAARQEYQRFVRAQLERYLDWQSQAEQGYSYIPWRFLIPVKTASDMYNWTARRIAKQPLIAFETKIKPPKWRIVLQVLVNVVICRFLTKAKLGPVTTNRGSIGV